MTAPASCPGRQVLWRLKLPAFGQGRAAEVGPRSGQGPDPYRAGICGGAAEQAEGRPGDVQPIRPAARTGVFSAGVDAAADAADLDMRTTRELGAKRETE